MVKATKFHIRYKQMMMLLYPLGKFFLDVLAVILFALSTYDRSSYKLFYAKWILYFIFWLNLISKFIREPKPKILFFQKKTNILELVTILPQILILAAFANKTAGVGFLRVAMM